MENENYAETMRLEIKKIEKAKKDSLAWLNGVLASVTVFLTTILVLNQHSKGEPASDMEGIVSMILIYFSSLGLSICGSKTIENVESLIKHKKKVKLMEENKSNFVIID